MKEEKQLVKTGAEIWKELRDNIKDTEKPLTRMFDKKVFDKYLILPDGLDALEEMLKDDALLHYNVAVSYDVVKNITSVFARFKRENKL